MASLYSSLKKKNLYEVCLIIKERQVNKMRSTVGFHWNVVFKLVKTLSPKRYQYVIVQGIKPLSVLEYYYF